MESKDVVKTKGRIVYIEPNDLVRYFGINSINGASPYEVGLNADNIMWRQEDLNMSVDLQVIMPDREDCGTVGFNDHFFVQINNDNSSPVGRYVSFLQGSDIKRDTDGETVGHELTTSYLEASYQEIINNKESNKESLGIESIDITFDSHFYPQVNIKFIDVRGYSLMMPTEEAFRQNLKTANGDSEAGKFNSAYHNFFRALFRFPYPRFLLTIKGYYGNSITFMLAVNEFHNSFNSSTGNFEVTVSFIGYMYGLYTDLPLNFLICSPYYGCTGNDMKTKGKYWRGYKYANNETDILTFVEFIDKCNSLTHLESNVKHGTTGNSTLDDIQKMTAEKEALQDLESAFSLFRASCVTENKNLDYKYEYSLIQDKYPETDGKIRNLLFLSRVESRQMYYNKQKYSEFIKKFSDYTSNYREFTGVVYPSVLWDNETKKWKQSPEIKAECTAFYTKKQGTNEYEENANRTCKTGGGVIKLSDLKTKYKRVYDKLSKDPHRHYFNVIMPFGSLIDAIANRITELTRKLDEASKSEDTKNASKTEYVNALGFDPTIQNMYRMIFAHIDCFMGGYYDLLHKIKEKNRHLKDLGSISLDLTDLNKSGGDNPFVPPFAGFYKNEGGKRVEIYPGDNESLRGMEEVEYIENLIKAVLTAKESEKSISLREAENNNWNEESEHSKNSEGQGFSVSSFTDLLRDGKNPWTAFDTLIGGKSPDTSSVGALIYFFILRYAQSKLQMKDIVDEASYASGEYSNFSALHPSIPNQEFKDAINTLLNGSDEEVKTHIIDALKGFKNGKTLVTKDGLEIEDSKITLKDENIPLYFNGDNLVNNTAAIVDKDKNERLFDLFENGYHETATTYRTTISNYAMGDKEKFKSKVDLTKSGIEPNYSDALDKGNKECINKELGRFAIYGNGTFNYAGNNNEGEAFFSAPYKDLGSSEKKAAYFLMPLMVSLLENSGSGTINFSNSSEYKYIAKLGNNFGKTGISCFPYVVSLYYGAFLKGLYSDVTKNTGKENLVTYWNTHSADGSFTIKEYGVNAEHLKAVKNSKTLKEKLIKRFDDFVSKEWPKIYPLISDKNKGYTWIDKSWYEADNDHYEFTDNTRSVIAKAIGGRNMYVWEIVNENHPNGNSKMDIPVSMIKDFITKIQEGYNKGKSLDEQQRDSTMKMSDVSSNLKLALYNSLKNLYDKWANSYSEKDFELRSPSDDEEVKRKRYMQGDIHNYVKDNGLKEFDNFVFIDSFYNDISAAYRINPRTVLELIMEHMDNDINYSACEFMADLCQKNKLLFIALPVFNNFYTKQGIANVFTPNIDETMMRGYGSTYVCMHTYEVSHVIEDESVTGLHDDGLDIAGIIENTEPTDINALQLFSDQESDGEKRLGYTIPAFGVTYAKQNQGYFKSINVNMDNPRTTDYSIANLFELSNFKVNGTINKPYTIANDIYSIYANRSYNCSVEMMGCANIMPMMYFQLNNIPMFRGAYMITNVEHHIAAGEFTTKFTGVRISRNQLPFNDEIFNLVSLINNGSGSLSDDTYTGDGSGNSNVGNGNYGSPDPTNVKCSNWDIDKAMQAMYGQVWTPKCGMVTPSKKNTSNCSGCVDSVKTYVAAGFGKKREDMGSWGNGKDAGKGAEKYGWKLKFTIPKGKTRQELKDITNKECIAGDIATMYHGNSTSKAGHICMYNGKQWVSDFFQDCVYVYFKDESDKKTSYPIKIFRREDCEYKHSSNESPSALSNTTNMTETQRGSYIMKYLERSCGFNKEQVIGVAAGLRQESMTSQYGGWSPSALNSSSGAAGLAQWLGSRVSKIVGYVNAHFNKSYPSTGKGIASMTLEEQCYALCEEVKNTKYKNKNSGYNDKTYQEIIKAQTTAENALQAWIKYFERSDASWTVYKKSIPIARNAYGT